jgi:hypothetical protein
MQGLVGLSLKVCFWCLTAGKLNLAMPPFPELQYAAPLSSSSRAPRIDSLELLIAKETNIAEVFSSFLTRKARLNSILPEVILGKLGKGMHEIMDHLNGVLARTLLSLESSCGDLVIDVSSSPLLPRVSVDVPRASFDVTFGGTALSTEIVDLGGGSLPLPTGNYGTTSGHSSANSFGSISASHYNTAPGTLSAGAVPAVTASDDTNKQMMFDLLCASFDSIPRLVPFPGITFTKLIEILSRFVVHVDVPVRNSAYDALMRLARLDDDCVRAGGGFWDVNVGDGHSPGVFARVIVRIYRECCIKLCNDLYKDKVVSLIATTAESWESCPYYNSLRAFIGLCGIWIERVEACGEGSVTLDSSEITWIADGIECFGLLNLCNSFPCVRKEGIVILRLAERLEKLLIEKRRDEFNDRGGGIVDDARELPKRSRVMKIIEHCGPGLVKRSFHSRESVYHKPAEGKSKREVKIEVQPSLLEIAISESDQTLWMRCFSGLVSDILEYGNLQAVNACLFSVLVWTENLNI